MCCQGRSGVSLLGAEVKLNSCVPAASGTWMLEGELVPHCRMRGSMLFFSPSALHSHQLRRPCSWPSWCAGNAPCKFFQAWWIFGIFFSNVLLKPHGHICIIFSLYFLFESVLVITFSIFKLYKAVSLRLLSVFSFNSFKLLPDVPALRWFLLHGSSEALPSCLVVDSGRYTSFMGQKFRQFDCQPSAAPFSTHRCRASLLVPEPSVVITLPPQGYLQSHVDIIAVLWSIWWCVQMNKHFGSWTKEPFTKRTLNVICFSIH